MNFGPQTWDFGTIMRDEVEEFLRRVAQMRAAAEAQARAGQQRQVPVPPPPQQTFVPPRPAAPPQVVYVQPQEAAVVDAELADTDDSVARHVAQHLRGSSEIAEHTRHLGEEVDAADNKMEAHLHQVFDHQLGRLRKSVTDVGAAAASDAKRTGLTAGSIAGMLLSQENICNAIILGEILRRPDENW